MKLLQRRPNIIDVALNFVVVVGDDGDGTVGTWSISYEGGQTRFLGLMADTWQHRREEPFDYDGALEGLGILSSHVVPDILRRSDLPVEQERLAGKIKDEAEILVERLRAQRSMAGKPLTHRERDPNRRDVKKDSGASLQMRIEQLGRLWMQWRRWIYQQGDSSVNNPRTREMEAKVIRFHHW